MCGHAGLIIANPSDFVSKPKYKLVGNVSSNNAADIAAALLAENQFYRGGDGFGLMALSKISLSDPTLGNNYRVSFVKKVDEFTNKWGTVIDSEKVFTTTGVVCMHARKMTAGTKVYSLTHPIHVDHITLMHNGSIPNWSNLFPSCGSDTVGLAKMLSEEGIQRVAETIEGAKTLVWLDSTEGSLNFFKHSERPLYMYKTGDSFVYASEEWMVFKALDQYGLSRDGQVVFEDGYHYKYLVEERQWETPVKYKNPEPAASRSYDHYSKKKEMDGVVVMGAVSPPMKQTTNGVGTSVKTTTHHSAVYGRRTLLTTDAFAFQLHKVTDHTEKVVCASGSLVPSCYDLPEDFIMKDVKVFLPTAFKEAINLLIAAGVYLKSTPVRSTYYNSHYVVADGIKGLVFCFDPSLTEKELASIDGAAIELHKVLSKFDVPRSTLDNIRYYCEMLDGFSENKKNPLGLTLVKHPARLGVLKAEGLTKIPQV